MQTPEMLYAISDAQAIAATLQDMNEPASQDLCAKLRNALDMAVAELNSKKPTPEA